MWLHLVFDVDLDRTYLLVAELITTKDKLDNVSTNGELGRFGRGHGLEEGLGRKGCGIDPFEESGLFVVLGIRCRLKEVGLCIGEGKGECFRGVRSLA